MSCHFVPGDEVLRIGYCLRDGIYFEWPFFVHPIHDTPAGPYIEYENLEERVCKVIERLCGVMQDRVKILRRERDLWDLLDVVFQLSVLCLIVHNILIPLLQSDLFDVEIEENYGMFTFAVVS